MWDMYSKAWALVREVVSVALRQRRGQMPCHRRRHDVVGEPLPDSHRDAYLLQLKVPRPCEQAQLPRSDD